MIAWVLQTEGLADVPFLILGNKIDMREAASEHEMRGALGLHNMTTGKGNVAVHDGVRRGMCACATLGHAFCFDARAPPQVRPIEVFCCSVVRRQGYKEGFQWLAQYIA